jgi:hypothetical protein
METAVPTSISDATSNFKRALALQADAVITHMAADATAASDKLQLSTTMPSAPTGKIGTAS